MACCAWFCSRTVRWECKCGHRYLQAWWLHFPSIWRMHLSQQTNTFLLLGPPVQLLCLHARWNQQKNMAMCKEPNSLSSVQFLSSPSWIFPRTIWGAPVHAMLTKQPMRRKYLSHSDGSRWLGCAKKSFRTSGRLFLPTCAIPDLLHGLDSFFAAFLECKKVTLPLWNTEEGMLFTHKELVCTVYDPCGWNTEESVQPTRKQSRTH